MAFAVIATVVASLAFDWNESHAFNPAWAPHARFHEVAYLWFEVGIAALVLWLLWRRSDEPSIGVAAAAWVPVLKEAAFVVAALTPGAHFEDHAGEVPLFLGVPVNLIHPGLVALLSIVGYWVYRAAVDKP